MNLASVYFLIFSNSQDYKKNKLNQDKNQSKLIEIAIKPYL